MWPQADEFYEAQSNEREARPNRPLFQGDVFVDVPFAIANPKRPDEHYFLEREANVLLIGHPCVMRAGAQTLPVQSAVEVRKHADDSESFASLRPAVRQPLPPVPVAHAPRRYRLCGGLPPNRNNADSRVRRATGGLSR